MTVYIYIRRTYDCIFTEGADWGNVQICALFALWIQPFTAHSAN